MGGPERMSRSARNQATPEFRSVSGTQRPDLPANAQRTLNPLLFSLFAADSSHSTGKVGQTPGPAGAAA